LEFGRDKQGYISSVRIEARVEPEDRVKRVIINEPGKPPHLASTGGTRVYRKLVEDLQSIESSLALYLNLSRVRWEEATTIVVPETPEEQADIQFNNFKMAATVPDEPTHVSAQDLAGILGIAEACRDLAATMAFYREGETDLKHLRYITAFFSFYFILEGLYRHGKTKNKDVEAEFKNSSVLVECVDNFISVGERVRRPQFVYSLSQLVERSQGKWDRRGVIHMIVWTRGHLHHFVNKPTRESGTPFTHARYETLALFMQKLTRICLMREVQARVDNAVAKSASVHPQ
jgi:hypothetical protein